VTHQPAIGERVDDDEARYCLPRSVVPHRYDLVLEPDLEAATFAGSETVTLEVVEPVDEIVLNAVDLDVGPGRLEGPGGTLEVSTIRLDPESERAHLLLSGTAEPGVWTLHLEFGGKLSD
jgi:Peptidase M1 N-terminal domain